VYHGVASPEALALRVQWEKGDWGWISPRETPAHVPFVLERQMSVAARSVRLRRIHLVIIACLSSAVVSVLLAAAPPSDPGRGSSAWRRAMLQVACTGGATAITPCGTSADTLAPSFNGQRTFSVTNGSGTDHTYTPSCTATLPVASCSVDPSVLVVPAGGSASIAVSYTASSATATSAGTVTVAVDGGAPDQVMTSIAVGPAATTDTPQ
jgi:hypothetical protein